MSNATSADYLLSINRSREAVRVAINRRGINVPPDTPFRLYAEKIMEIVGDTNIGVTGAPINLRGPMYDIPAYSFHRIKFNNRIKLSSLYEFNSINFTNRIKLSSLYLLNSINFTRKISLTKQLILRPVTFTKK